MNKPCPEMQDRIADYVLGTLLPPDAAILRKHLATCAACRQYVQSLKGETKSLVALGAQIDADMEARQNRVIQALQEEAPAEAGPQRVLPFWNLVKRAVAVVLVLGAGVGIGRWTAPRGVDVERLRADLQASLTASVAGTVQESIRAQVDQRVQASLAKSEAKLRTELAGQVQDNLQRLVAQAESNSKDLVDKRYDELVQIVEEARRKDRQHFLDALEQSRLRTKAQVAMGLQSLATLTTGAKPAVQ